MTNAQSWRIARLEAERRRLADENRALRIRLDATRELCRSFACSCRISEGRCSDDACRCATGPRDWCDDVLFIAEPM